MSCIDVRVQFGSTEVCEKNGGGKFKKRVLSQNKIYSLNQPTENLRNAKGIPSPHQTRSLHLHNSLDGAWQFTHSVSVSGPATVTGRY